MEETFGLKAAAGEVGMAVRRPEQVVGRWCEVSEASPRKFTIVIGLLLANAIFGTAAYGATMHMHDGALSMLWAAVMTPIAAGGAWTIALPALYIFNRALGSQLGLQETLLAASITVCFGAWAMLASVPMNWFFSLALPYGTIRLMVNIVVFTGVGICMTDVFLRILHTLEPQRSPAYGRLWVGLLAIIGAELFAIFGIFAF